MIALLIVLLSPSHLALAASEVTDSILLLSTNEADFPAAAASANALAELSHAMAVRFHNPTCAPAYHVDKARGALTAAIELTRNGPGTVGNLKGERDHPALYSLRKARAMLESTP